ncbi:Fis family transcriptional regulator [Sulfurovum sp. bin170]|uniref:helix-turn-helix domain-containing protein n=1 Tax=Sulfurovum sp. bin170 TaxID=2695268 RepID=UPI0013DEA0CE|nr:helix-turn-helix domain-containing protein [Sulfurovum sp. bin170]NEW60050.1 Fis family transcriptional regulator [Sulfurovum sp. bin170]
MNKTEFFSHSPEIQSIIKALTLSKSLFISTIIWGEPHTGKLTLVRSFFPKTTLVNGKNLDTLKDALESSDEVIIYNFEAIRNIQLLDLDNKRIIAIANYEKLPLSIESHFAFIYNMPPLRERTKDIPYFLEKFSKELKDDLMIKDDIELDINHLDLSQNFKSLKISLHRELIKKTLSQQDIEEILFDYLYHKIKGKNAYRENLGLYEKPLIQAGLKKFKSQLKLSEVLGLNRNTLRKKIHEHNIN